MGSYKDETGIVSTLKDFISQVLSQTAVQRGGELVMRRPLSREVQCWKEQCGGLQKTCAPQHHCQLTLDGTVPLSGSQLVLKEWFSSWLYRCNFEQST